MMDWQLTSVIAIVAAAALYLGWATLRAVRRAKTGCGGCGCSTKPASTEPLRLISPDDVTLRRRTPRE